MIMSRAATPMIWAGLVGVILFLYAPLFLPIVLAFNDPVTGRVTLANFSAVLGDSTLLTGLQNSLYLAIVVAIVASLLGLAAAQAVRTFRMPRLIMTIILLPLFIPGVSMGVSTGLFFEIASIRPSLLTMAVVQTLWALPFSFLIILTAMSGFDPVYLEAAYTCGANRFQAFREIELPQIASGLTGAVTCSAILSFNETIRTAVVQGGNSTIQTFIWSRYQQVGLTPAMHALMSLIIAFTLILVVMLLLAERRSDSPGAPADRAGKRERP
jgi:putative spermidine/putrescine transport system permease protein/spermidine/putrescine transport system permease protein